MARRYNIELSASIKAGTVNAAASGLEKLGLSAEEVEGTLKGLASANDATTEQMRQGFLRAAAAVDQLMREVENGSPRAAKSITRINMEVEDLREEIAKCRKAGAPIPPNADDLLERYDRSVEEATEELARFRDAQGDTADALREAEGGIGLQGDSIGELGDIFNLMGPRVAGYAANVTALAGGFMVGWEAGTQFRELLNNWTGGKFDAWIQGAINKLFRFRDAVADLDQDAQYQANLANIRSKRGKGYSDRLDLSQEETDALKERLAKLDEAAKKAAEEAKQEAERNREAQRAADLAIASRERLNAAASRGLKDYERQVVLEARETEYLAKSKGLTKDHAAELRRKLEWAWALDEANKSVLDKLRLELQFAREIRDAVAATAVVGKELANAQWLEGREAERERQSSRFEVRVVEPMRDRALEIADYRKQLEPIGEAWEKELRRIRDLTQKEGGLWGLTVEEAQQHITRIYMQRTAEVVGSLQGLLGSLSGVFGDRAGIRNAQRVLGSIQQVQSIYSQTQQAAGALGASTAMSGAAAAAGATFAIFAIIYQGVDAYLKKKRAMNFGNAMELSAIGGDFAVQSLSFEADRYLRSLRDTIEGIAASIHARVEEMPKISIRVRNDGKKFEARVGDMFIGVFNSIEDATSAALAQVIRQTEFRGADPIVQQALANSGHQTMEELNRSLQMAQELADVALNDGERAMRSIQERMMEYVRWMQENRITDPTAAANLGSMTMFDITALRDQITGHQRSAAEQLALQRLQADMLDQRVAMMRTELQLERARLQRERDSLEARGRFTRANLAIDRGEFELDQFELLLGREFNYFKAQELEQRANLYQAELELFDTQMRQIDELLRQLEDYKPINGDVRLNRGGGGGGGMTRRDRIEDAIENARNQRLGEFGRQVLETRQRWDELTRGMGTSEEEALRRAARTRDEAIRKAEGNAEAIRKANEAYRRTVANINRTADALDRANAARAEEFRLLGEQARRDAITPFTGPRGGRTAEAQQLEELHAYYRDLRQNRRDLGLSLAEVNAAERERGRLLGLEVQAALGIEGAGVAQELEATANRLAFLRDHAAELGLTAQQAADVAAQVDQSFYLGMAERIAKASGDEALLAELQEARYDIERANMQLAIEKAQLEGVISQETYNRLLLLLGKLPEDMPKAPPPPVSREGTADVAARRQEEAARAQQDAARRMQTAVDRLRSMTEKILFGDGGLLSPEQQVDHLLAQMRAVAPNALRGDVGAVEALGEIEGALYDVLRRAYGSGEQGADILREILAYNTRIEGLTGARVGNVAYDQRLGFPSPAAPSLPLAPLGSASAPVGGDVAAAVMQGAAGLGREVALLRGEVAQVREQLRAFVQRMDQDASLRRREAAALEGVLRRVS